MTRSVWKGPFVDGYLLKKAEAAKAEQEASKKTDGRILLYSDIIDALYDEMPVKD